MSKVISLLLFSGILLFEGVVSFNAIFLTNEAPLAQGTQTEQTTEIDNSNPYEKLSLVADSAIVLDTVTGKILYSKNPDEVRPIASITKVVSAMISDEILNPREKVAIVSDALAQDDDNGLWLDEIWPFKKLLDFSLLVSSNDGAYAIANIAGAVQSKKEQTFDGTSTTSVDTFVRLMNEKMSLIGLPNTRFNNPSGLDLDEAESGGYSNASEVAQLFAYVLKNNPHLLEATSEEADQFMSDNGLLHPAKNTNESFPSIPGLLASKTGYTDLAGGNLAIAYDVGINYPVVVVVLGSGYKDRFDDIANLVQATNEHFAK